MPTTFVHFIVQITRIVTLSVEIMYVSEFLDPCDYGPGPDDPRGLGAFSIRDEEEGTRTKTGRTTIRA